MQGDSGPKRKTCSKCGERKGLDCFDKEKTGADGLRCKCKRCRAEEHAKWHRANYDRIKDRKNELARKRYAERKALGLIGKRKWKEKTRRWMPTLSTKAKPNSAAWSFC